MKRRYLGIHIYIIGNNDLLDAYHDAKGNETFVRLGARNAYSKIPAGRLSSISFAQL